MTKTKFNFVGNLKKCLIISGVFFLIGVIVACIFGVKFHVNYTGGSRFTYTYTGELDTEACAKIITDSVSIPASATSSKSLVGDETKLVITLASSDVVVTDMQSAITETLTEAYPDNNVEFGEANTVSPSVAGRFFIKSIVAVIIAAILVIIYLGIRFKKIGGISAGLASFACLLHDCIMAFIACIIFRLEIDANFIAVVLTILGYSINATIVIYDRIRENHVNNPAMSVTDTVNKSINETLARSIVTSLSTFLSIVTIIVVAECFGISSLRTFAIPMAIGVVFGCYSSVCLSGPIWATWKESRKAKAKKK